MSVNPTKSEVLKWTSALRSGKFKQTTNGHLQDSAGHCCLGVACEIFIPKDEQRRYYSDPLEHLYGALPWEQKSAPPWLKNINEDFALRIKASLSDLNDGRDAGIHRPLTFNEIADLLELVYIHGAL